jgi:H+-transporting ATPase
LSVRGLSIKDFERISLDEAFKLLSSGPNGLSEDEARRRLGVYGPSVVEEKKESPLLGFLKRFRDQCLGF